MKRSQRRQRRVAGFTLMEVLLVLTILVILGSMVSFYFIGARRKALMQAAETQMHGFESFLNLYNLDIGTYPTTQQGLQALRQAPSDLGNAQQWAGPYAAKDIPPDPLGNQYQYEQSGDAFRIWSVGPDGQDGTEDDIEVRSG